MCFPNKSAIEINVGGFDYGDIGEFGHTFPFSGYLLAEGDNILGLLAAVG